MCLGCVSEYGEGIPDMTPEVYEAFDAAKAVYKRWPTGGPLHVILDDTNVEDAQFTHAKGTHFWNYISVKDYVDCDKAGDKALVVRSYDTLRVLSPHQRALVSSAVYDDSLEQAVKTLQSYYGAK